MIKKATSTVRALAVFFIFCLFLHSAALAAPGPAAANASTAKDLSGHFTIISPESVKHASYGLPDPSFVITAPQGWYLAQRLPMEPGNDRVFFSKEDPKKALSQGIYGDFGFPSIFVMIYANDQKRSADVVHELSIRDLESRKKTFMVKEMLNINTNLVSHFVTKDAAHPDLVGNTYIFVTNKLLVQVAGDCKPSEWDSFKKKIAEAVNSVSFDPAELYRNHK